MLNSSRRPRFLLTFLFSVIIIVICSHVIVNRNVTDTPLNTILLKYSIESILTDEEALDIMNSEGVQSVLEAENVYVFKTDSDTYYAMNKDGVTDLGLQLAGIEVKEEVKSLTVGTVINIVAYTLLFILIIKLIIDAINYRKAMNFTNILAGAGIFEDKSVNINERDMEKKKENIQTVKFDDVQGIDELKPDLFRLVDCLKNSEKYTSLGARMPKGVILYGPPGTGKTLTAKAIAGEADVPFYSMCGSDFMEKYVGVGASRIRELYNKARKTAPCIVFIDEIDSIGAGRGESNNSERDQTINALLAELDGFKGDETILTICATNRLDILDPALLRPGRFDLKLAIGLPDKEGRLAILKIHSANKKFAEDVSLEDIAKQTMGFSGASLENLLNESALLAAERNKEVISKDEIEEAFYKVIMNGNKKKRKAEDKEDTILTAWHEAGHTLATKLLTKDSVTTVTIIPSTSGAGGVTFTAPDENNLPSKKYLKNQIKVDYAGRAAEELYLGSAEDVTTGASQDIIQATSVIKSYIGAYGMGNQGLIDIRQLTNHYDIVEEAGVLSKELYKETLDFLKENKVTLEALANALVEKETLYENEIDAIIAEHKEQKEMANVEVR